MIKKTFRYLYDRTNDRFPYYYYGLQNSRGITNSPYQTAEEIKGVVESGNKNKSRYIKDSSDGNKYYKVGDIPELIAKYEMGDKTLDGLLNRFANELDVDGVGGLKKVPREFFDHYQKTVST